MKKIILFLGAIIILIPLNLKADITAKLTGPKEVTIGEQLTIKYTINVPNVGQTDTNIKGIVGIAYNIDYDQNLLSLRSVSANNYETTFANKEGKMFVESEPKTYDCLEEVAYCSSGFYTATLTFNILSKETKPASIKITDPIIGVIDLKDIYEGMLNDLSEEELIRQALKESPNNFETLIVTLKKPKEEDTRSSNTNLSLLEIQNYPIDFNKDTKEYEITVGKNINRLVIKAETEDEKSKATIKGNDDLASNDNKVTIEVKAENETITTYTINVKHKDEEDEIIPETKPKKPKTKINADKKILKLMGAICGCILLIIILIITSTIIKKRKINKMFDEL